MWPNLSADFNRALDASSYGKRWRAKLHVLTSEPGFHAVTAYRMTRWLYRRRIPLIGAVIRRLSEIWSGISIPPEATIGPGLLIYHFGGIMINSKAVLGRDCTLHHGVTIGNRRTGGGSPVIGDRVMVGAGAKVLGELTVGDDVEVGANAVVTSSVPDRAVVVGIPAHVVRIKETASQVTSDK